MANGKIKCDDCGEIYCDYCINTDKRKISWCATCCKIQCENCKNFFNMDSRKCIKCEQFTCSNCYYYCDICDLATCINCEDEDSMILCCKCPKWLCQHCKEYCVNKCKTCVKDSAALFIQCRWRWIISKPDYKLCIKRLNNEFLEWDIS